MNFYLQDCIHQHLKGCGFLPQQSWHKRLKIKIWKIMLLFVLDFGKIISCSKTDCFYVYILIYRFLNTYKFKNPINQQKTDKKRGMKLAKKCIYCSAEISSESVVDICQKCMYQVWGEKMAKAIVENMQKEKNKGNMELGNVSGEARTEEIKQEVIIEEPKPGLNDLREITEINEIEEVPHNENTEFF